MKLRLVLLVALVAGQTFGNAGTAARESAPREPSETGLLATSSPFGIHGCGFFDILSGYEFRGALLNDEPVYWTYAELNATYSDVVSIGGWVFQNTDMTCRRKSEMRRMNEWDAAANVRLSPELTEGWRLGMELGHCWCCMHALRGKAADCYSRPATEIYALLWLENPYLVPYCTFEYGYDAFEGTAFSFGLRRAFDLPFGLELAPKIVVGGGDADYNAGIYPPFDGSVGSGIAYLQLGASLSYWITENFGIRAQADFTVLVDPDIRNAIDDYGDTYRNEFVCGGLGAVFAF